MGLLLETQHPLGGGGPLQPHGPILNRWHWQYAA